LGERGADSPRLRANIVRVRSAGSALATAALVLWAALALAASQDVLLYSEALKADQRMFDTAQAFANALRSALGRERLYRVD